MAKNDKEKYRGRLRQIPIYTGKMFRMFIYQNDWKSVPMAAVIAALVSIVIKETFGVTMEGTAKGALAISSVSLWNGFFNSVQVICRERDIVKREHRSGMHISSYITSHMIYQGFICLIQSVTTCLVFKATGIKMHAEGIVFDSYMLDLIITVFMITYSADMLSLFISSLAKTTTAAMTVMPLVLMVQLIFSGTLFSLPDSMSGLSELMISRQGTCAISAETHYNELSSNAGWNMVKKLGKGSDDPSYALVIADMEAEGYDKKINEMVANSNYKEAYVSTAANMKKRWLFMGALAIVFAAASVISLEFIDRDRR